MPNLIMVDISKGDYTWNQIILFSYVWFEFSQTSENVVKMFLNFKNSKIEHRKALQAQYPSFQNLLASLNKSDDMKTGQYGSSIKNSSTIH